MRQASVRQLLTTSLILMLAGLSPASAHTLQNNLAASKTATAKWEIVCYPPATQMVVRLSQTQKTKNFRVALDVKAGEESLLMESIPLKKVWTPYDSIQAGAVPYVLSLSKVGSNTQGKVTYVVDNHCEAASGAHTQQSAPKRLR